MSHILIAYDTTEGQTCKTVARFLDSIRASGFEPGNRQHVHLSSDVETARKVGQRHGQPVILMVESGRMWRDGHTFYRARNGVWQTEHDESDRHVYRTPIDEISVVAYFQGLVAILFPTFLPRFGCSNTNMKMGGAVKNQKRRLNDEWFRHSASRQLDNYTLGWER